MQYEAPELQFVGDAEEVVLGLDGFGGDHAGEEMDFGMEFAED